MRQYLRWQVRPSDQLSGAGMLTWMWDVTQLCVDADGTGPRSVHFAIGLSIIMTQVPFAYEMVGWENRIAHLRHGVGMFADHTQ
jgi:hypothetical protein